MNELKKTSLYDWHLAHGANMAPFGAYEMPLWYQEGVKAEHLGVIKNAGIFDTSHMAAVTVTGTQARDLLQYCFTKDLEHCIGKNKTPLVAGRCVYGLFLNEDGSVLDDAIVLQLSATSFMVVVNAAMGAAVAARLNEFNGPFGTTITDLTDKVGKMDIQGPDSAKVLAKILDNAETIFEKFLYFSFKGGFGNIGDANTVRLKDGTPLLLSRTGYTGEFGFELFMTGEDLIRVWEMVLEAGAEFGVLPCGLAARDSLRAGAVLPLSHQDIGPWIFANTPWDFALPLDEQEFSKDFHGKKALSESSKKEYTLPFAGYNPRKIVISENTYVTDESGANLGVILTCATDMAIDRVDGKIVSIASTDDKNFAPKGLSCGFIKINKNLAPGSEVILTDGKKKKIPVRVEKDIRPGRTARKPMKDML